MPYEWSPEYPPAGTPQTLRLWPHRSLPRRGFAVFILITFGMITIPLFPLMGTMLFWGMLPFMLLALGAIWWAIQRNYRDGTLNEVLTIDAETAHLMRSNPNGKTQEWECQSYWAKVEMHEQGGPVPFYVTLSGKGRQVEIGAFLSEDERKSLYGELRDALIRVARTG